MVAVAVAAFGTTVTLENGFVGSLRVRHFGDAPLSEDNSVQKDGTTLVNLGLAYPFGEFEIGLDVLNIFRLGRRRYRVFLREPAIQ